MAKSSNRRITFSGSNAYTLTGSYVNSDAAVIDFAEMSKLAISYTPATNNAQVNFQIEINPFSAEEDTAGTYWMPMGFYVDGSGNQQTNATGSWITQTATFNSLATSTATTVYNLVPVPMNVLSAKQIRVKAKETGGTSAGAVEFIITKNDY